MRLVHRANHQPVLVGDVVLVGGTPHMVTYFRPPDHSSSEGKIIVRAVGSTPADHGAEYYVGVVGAEWIEREDRGQG
jgi:hypothetical protein